MHYSTENENIKAGMVERFNRTLREVMSRLMEHRGSNCYVDVLDDLIDGYINTPHSRHGGVPAKIEAGDSGFRSLKGRHLRRCNQLLKLETMFAWLDREGCLRVVTMRDGQERCLW